ncbi:MAG: hypothetical protein HFG08_00700 [Oscillibacter sp.]|nr:hypothetical protein [Oscillibacter sp.]
MKKIQFRRRDFFQNAAIVLLFLLAVALFTQTQLYSLEAGAGYLDSLLEGDASQNTSAPSEILAGFAAPVRTAVTGVYGGRYGSTAMTTADEEFEPLGSLLQETLGSAQAPEPCAVQDFLQALNSSSVVYYDFLNPLPLSIVAGLTAASWDGDSPTVRQLAVAAGADGAVSLYLWDGGEFCCRAASAVSAGELARIVNRYEFNGAMFAFDSEALFSLAPCSLLPAEPPELPSLTSAVSLPGTETLLSSLGFYPRTNSRYPEPDGTEVITEGNRILRVSADGTVRYRGGGENVITVSAAGESPTAAEAAAGVWTLLNNLLTPYAGEARLYLQSVRQTEASTSLVFGYQIGGVPIRSATGAAAAQATLSGVAVTTLTLRFRQYSSAGEAAPMLPLRQALGIAAAGNGGELSIGYADSGGAASAQWLVD